MDNLRKAVENILKGYFSLDEYPGLLDELVAVFDKSKQQTLLKKVNERGVDLDWLLAGGVSAEEIAKLAEEEQVAKGTSWSGREKMPEAIRELLDTFVKVSGIKPVAGQQYDWLKTGSDWLEIGATKQDIVKAFEESKPNEKGFGGFACYRPGSLTGAIQKVVGQRRASHTGGTRLERALAEIAEMVHE